MNPLFISICIPAYNADRYLGATLDAVRTQTHRHWELIVVEDGSRDRTQDIVANFAATVPQPVRYLRHDRNRGLPATRNTAIAAAGAGWIALLDSDDLWTPDHLASLAAAAQAGCGDLIHGGSILFESSSGKLLGVRTPTRAMLQDFPRSLFVGAYIIQPSSVLLHRRLWDRVGGFDPDFRYVEDREMWLRCARAGARFHYTRYETCLYRRHAAALSTHAVSMAEAAAAVCEKHLDWEPIPRSVRRRVTAETWAAAGRLCQRTDPGRSSRNFHHACGFDWRLGWFLRALACTVLAGVRSRRSGVPVAPTSAQPPVP